MHTARRSRGDRWAFAALVAMFALLVQAMLPPSAMASAAASDPFSIICTGSGTATAQAESAAEKPAKGFAGMPCQDCLAAAMAFVATPELTIAPVAYAVAFVEHEPDAQHIAPRARAPPRPFGQGPPTA